MAQGLLGQLLPCILHRVGDEVTVIARGKRLQQLQSTKAIVTTNGQIVKVDVASELDVTIEFDLVLVVVLAHQVGAVLDTLRESIAKTIMFMFLTFESIERLQEVVGVNRFAFGYPAIRGFIHEDGKLDYDVYSRGITTISTDMKWAALFTDAGIPTKVQREMQSWLCTHAAMAVIVESLGVEVLTHNAGVSWTRANEYAWALKEGFSLVHKVGCSIVPRFKGVFFYLPIMMIAAVIWGVSRLKAIRDVGALGPSEPRGLIDAMVQLSSVDLPWLRRIRPPE